MGSGHHHIKLSKESQHKSVFVTLKGKFEFTYVHFQFTRASAYFQRLVNEVLTGLHFAFGYLDDILIFSLSVKTLFKHLEILFHRLREGNLKLKQSECNLQKTNFQYLGHLISGHQIKPLPENL